LTAHWAGNRNHAVVHLFAWLLWGLVHITFQSGARLITGSEKR